MSNKSKIFQIFILSLLSIFVLVLGFFQIRRAIYAPFGGFIKPEVKEKIALTQEEILSILSEQAKQGDEEKDTDEDGVSDYDEIYVYHTSPYLNDSDGDVFTDKEEIDAESNPLDANSTPYKVTSVDNLNKEIPDLDSDNFPEDNLDKDKPSFNYIKNFLVEQAGMDEKTVNKIDDNLLEKLYNDTIEETGIDPEILELSNPTDEVDVSLLRQALIDEGVDTSILEQIDDDTLKSIFLENLEN